MLVTIIVCIALIAIDQVLKVLVVNFLAPIGSTVVIPGFAGLRYVENDGMAFNMLSGRQGILIAVTAVVLAVVGYILLFRIARKPSSKGILIGLTMVFSGGVGNLIDRIVHRYVVDYIEFLFVDFAVFNFADCLVTIGFVVLIISYIKVEYGNYKKRKAMETREEAPDGAD